MFLQNTGQYFWSLVISALRQGLVYIPLLSLLPAVYGQLGLFLTQPVADVLSFGIAGMVVYKKYGEILGALSYDNPK